MYVYWPKRYVLTGQRSRNSLKIIHKVLKYSWKHKIPERHSAFTYWENYILSQIDLGKDKYGGPFTYEQIEDVKSFLGLLLLILSLCGFQLPRDGYSLTYYIMNRSCFPSAVLLMIVMMLSPQDICFLVVLAVPIF